MDWKKMLPFHCLKAKEKAGKLGLNNVGKVGFEWA